MTLRKTPYARILLPLCALLPATAARAQLLGGEVHGNFSMDGQYYNDDEAIGAQAPPQTWGLNSWGNVNYASTNGLFKAGLRFEAYEPALLGYPAGQAYRGSGIGYRYVTFAKYGLEVTAGNFYEQFGQGLSFRSYEERYLGVDNAMDGVRLKFMPDTGIYIKGFIGQQRFGFESGTTKLNPGQGIVRGFDAEVSLAEAWPRCFPKWVERGRNVVVGGSFVSRFQSDNSSKYELPENVGTWAGRLNYTNPKWNVYAEYAHKINDPNHSNDFIYKDGEALLLNATYSVKGLGVSVGAHSYDNMVFQSDRTAPSLFDLNINFLPTLAKQHTYNLAATLYPYATQPNGEVSYQGEVFYKFKKGSALGGARGMKLAVNWCGAWSLDSTALPNDTVRLRGYRNNSLFSPGGRKYFQDLNIELRRKLSDRFELALTWINLFFDIAQVQGKPGHPAIYGDIVVVEGLYNLSDRNSLRFELQHLNTRQEKGNWATAVAELTFSPHWFVAAMDQYNYGGAVDTDEIHYPIVSAGYIRGANRFSMSYGRQRAGIFCVGGVCRVVPAANGLTLSVTSTF
ncbi:MAG TPA: DUF6029 family protein [Flavobacteriales bacterium]|nr:DUF6029 family protein [Flavobacteriales bacterium]